MWISKITIIVLLIPTLLSGQTTIYVEANQSGRGILRQRGNECFVITPNHVVENASTILNIYGNKAAKSSCEFLQSAPYDLAILRVNDDVGQDCSAWNLLKNYEQILNRNNTAFLEIREKSGSVRIVDVNIVEKDAEYISIRPSIPEMYIVKGWSGSALFVYDGSSKVYLGMLSDVDEGIGSVLRTDVMMLTLSTFFNTGQNISSTTKTSVNGLAYQEDKQVKCIVHDYEQNGQQFKIKFSLTNLNSSLTTTEESFPAHYSSFVDQEGYLFNGTSLRMGNQDGRSKLIYNTPVQCELTFNVGANNIDKIEKLDIKGYNLEFNFLNINKNVTDFSLEKQIASSQPKVVDLNKNLSDAVDKGVKCTIHHFEQNGSKGILHFSLLNTSNSQNRREVAIPAHYCKIQDQSGFQYEGSAIYLGNTGSRAQLITGVNLKCKIEFSIGVTSIERLSYINIHGYENSFEFFNIPVIEPDLSQENVSRREIQNENVIVPPKEKLLGELTEGDVNIKVVKFEQIGNKVIVSYFLTNKNASQQVLDFYTTPHYCEFHDLKGGVYQGGYVEIGSGNGRAQLIYNNPVPCMTEFNVGMNRISDIKYLKINGSTGDFEFNGKKGKMGQPASLKSKKASDTTNALLIGGGLLLLDSAIKEVDKSKQKKSGSN